MLVINKRAPAQLVVKICVAAALVNTPSSISAQPSTSDALIEFAPAESGFVAREVCLDGSPVELTQDGANPLSNKLLELNEQAQAKTQALIAKEQELSKAAKSVKKTQAKAKKQPTKKRKSAYKKALNQYLKRKIERAALVALRQEVEEQLASLVNLCSSSSLLASAPTINGTNPSSPVYQTALTPCQGGAASCLELTGSGFVSDMLLQIDIYAANSQNIRRSIIVAPNFISEVLLRLPIYNFVPVVARFTALAPQPGTNTLTSSNSLDITFSANHFDAQIVADRTSGVAPLAVFVDGATQSSGLTNDDFINANYEINFDSDQLNPVNPLSRERGFLAGHTYLVPGTYQIEAQVKDSAGRQATSPRTQITVLDPEQAFMPPLGETYCVATPGNPSFTGCPTTDPSKRIITTNLQSVLNLIGPNRRVLLSRAGQWSAGSLSLSGKQGPAHLGAFPNPNTASISKPQILSTNTATWGSILSTSGASDIRVTDLRLTGNFNGIQNGLNLTGIGAESAQHMLFSHLIIERTNDKALYLGWGANKARSVALTHSVFQDSDAYGIYAESYKTRISDNLIQNFTGHQHGMRFQAGYQTVVVRNSVLNFAGMTALTIRGDNTMSAVLDNVLQKGTSVSPQNNTSAEHVSDVLWEGNRHEPSIGQATMFGAITVVAARVVLRNNIFRNTEYAISLGSHALVPAAQDVDVYNNTFFNPLNVSQQAHTALNLAPFNFTQPSQVKRVKFFNNILYSGSATSWGSAISSQAPLAELETDSNVYYTPNQGANWTAASVSGQSYTFAQWQALGKDLSTLRINPQFVSIDPNAAAFLNLSASSPALDSGQSSPVVTDYFGDLRPVDGNQDGLASVDRGAFERQ